MSKTIPQLQQDINNLITSLATTTEMLAKIVPTTEEIKAHNMNPMTSMLMMVLGAQVEMNRALVNTIRETNPDAELQGAMARIDEIRNSKPTVQ